MDNDQQSGSDTARDSKWGNALDAYLVLEAKPPYNVTQASPDWLSLSGYDPSEVIGETITFLKKMDVANEDVLQALEWLTNGDPKEPAEGEGVLRTKEGAEYQTEWSATFEAGAITLRTTATSLSRIPPPCRIRAVSRKPSSDITDTYKVDLFEKDQSEDRPEAPPRLRRGSKGDEDRGASPFLKQANSRTSTFDGDVMFDMRAEFDDLVVVNPQRA